jgi:hypothetical protein
VLHEPVLNYNFSLEDAAAARGWQSANNYCVWVGLQSADELPYQLLVRPEDRILAVPLKPRQMHLIAAGTPYRVTHLFAPWRQCDADSIYLRVAEPEGIYTVLMTAMSRIVSSDNLVWLCPHCGQEMEREKFDVRTKNLIEFWSFQLQRVRILNATPRSCPSCDARQPLGYGFEPEHDTPDEAAARREW